MIKIKNWTILFLIAGWVISSQENNDQILKRLNEFMQDPRCDQTKMKSLLESGLMNGFFTTDEVQLIFDHLLSKFSDYVSTKAIGKTVEERSIPAYYLTGVKTGKSNLMKSKVLFTGAHHAREVITSNMIVKIFLETLHSLIHGHKKLTFWNYCDLIIVPIVNIDSHKFISDSFGTSDWDSHSMKRKNMNSKYCR